MRGRLGTLFRGLPISLATRLTVLLALVFALVLAVVGTVLVERVRSALDQQVLDHLAGEAALLSERLSLEATPTQWVTIIHRQITRTPTLQVELLDPTGRRVGVWNAISSLPAPRYLPAAELGVGANHSMALVAYPIDAGGFRLGAVVVAASLGTVNAYLADLSRRVLEAGGLGLVLAVVGSMVMTRRALEPLQKVAATAGEISSSEDLQRRLPAHGPYDEVRALSESFNAMLGRLEVAFDRQTRFVADASHELRTPLMVVKGYADLLDRWGQEDPAVRQEAVQAIQREAARMTRLVQDLLILADTDRGIDVNPSTVDVSTLLEEVRAEVEVIRPDRTATLDAPPGITVTADADRMRQLLWILVDNAIRYTREGGRIHLAASAQNDRVEIRVEDDGIGIPAEDLPHIFERFYRVEKARSRKVGGAGLGLSIASAIVATLGGQIRATSEVGHTVFTVRLHRASAPR